MESEEKKESTVKSIAREIFTFVLIAVGIVLPFRIYIAEPYLVSGASMDPTFENGHYLIVDKLSYRFSEPDRNMVVIFKYPLDPSKRFIKRIIGLPGETITAENGLVRIINEANPEGFLVNQPYVVHSSFDFFEKKLGPDEYFVMGDNRSGSYDSRLWGPLPKKYILGKPILRLLPLYEIKAWDFRPKPNQFRRYAPTLPIRLPI